MAIQRSEIVAEALNLLDAAGIEGLTMRGLAQRLQIQAPSLYWHFPSKQALMDSMSDALMEGVAREVSPSASCDERILQVAREIRSALLSRRDGAQVFSGTFVPTENVLRVGESLICALRDGGLDPGPAHWSAFSILYYILGFVIEEQGMAALDTAAFDAKKKALQKMYQAQFPNAFAAAEAVLSSDPDIRFTFGIKHLIGGLRLDGNSQHE
ncbi:TetR/AcrR family transcriptional regulator C-terminal domain-containing protein [Shinella daejeonensis]|uniref:TetR/AcrR family transcriptional regulator C-terminal domain-containing protein n=1 Tax=Shinella daejeonensis TaxID=659017 RepID=UPI0020C7EFE0|nr:TetR/AcrR family transcriptional regulator C-terminal domain-containing protein [Shinella daejeonensis]MCP8897650.1 TetR/AcrR family transcriptional regulator C-terminal domain-containing protein [Shinella daejeonensis]